jgi:cytochrome oxidase assembly protein ShyY1
LSTSKTDIRRWLGWLALVVVFAVACAFLSNWQFNRRQEALNAMAQLAANYDAPPVEISDVATRDSFDQTNEWRSVKLEGHYLPLNSVLVRNRPLDGEPGFLELVPFQLVTGEIVAVERGWLASDEKYLAPESYPIPEGDQQVVLGHIRKSEPTLGRSAPAGQLATINIEALVKSQGIKDLAYKSVYVRMSSESIASQKASKQLAKPQLDEGNHLSYALQWILFALMAAAALFWGIKKEREAVSGKTKVRTRKSVGQNDAEAEDSALGN